MKLVAIGGNIGCGKSTVIDALSKLFPCYPEPVDKWTPWLDLFYSDSKANALGFQIKILTEYSLMIKQLNSDKDKVVFIERSSYDNIYIFSKILLEYGDMKQHEYDLVKQLHDTLEIRQPDLYICIRTSPGECIKRIKERSRECEASIPEKYIHDLHQKYEEFLYHTPFKMAFVDGNQDKETVVDLIYNELKNL